MSSTTAPGAAIQAAPLSGLKLYAAAILIGLGNFLVVLDTTIANVSITTIAGSLGVSSTQGTWVITSYAVAEAITVPLTVARQEVRRAAHLHFRSWPSR